MIPKKIHYCWLSEDPFPDIIQKCIDSWKRVLPDYELIRWDLKRFPLDKNIWVKQAFEAKKYAFSADYIRLYALYTEGGIYLDCDVEVVKSFDDLLSLPYFVCKENSPQGIEAATIGAEKGCEWIGKCLAFYDGKEFINDNGVMSTQVLPIILNEIIETKYEIKYIKKPKEVLPNNNFIYILPYYYFSPKDYVTKRLKTTENTYSIHHFAGTWQSKWKKIILLIWVPFKVKFPAIAKKMKAYVNKQ